MCVLHYRPPFICCMTCACCQACLACRVNLVLVGAEGVVENGGIINKLGSYHVAIAAKEHAIPFYVAAESYKVISLHTWGITLSLLVRLFFSMHTAESHMLEKGCWSSVPCCQTRVGTSGSYYFGLGDLL